MICAPELAPVLVTFTVCGAGAMPPGTCVNESELWDTLSVFADVTFNVTAMVCGLLVTVAAPAVMVTVPV